MIFSVLRQTVSKTVVECKVDVFIIYRAVCFKEDYTISEMQGRSEPRESKILKLMQSISFNLFSVPLSIWRRCG